MPKETIVTTTITDEIAFVSINRPEKRNAMDVAVVTALQTAIVEANANSAVRIIILQAKGEHFCAGADIAWMQTIAQSSITENTQDAQQLAMLMFQIYQSTKPIIALAQGATMGGGLGVIAACDIAIVADNAYFAFSEVKLGLTPSVVSPYIVEAIGVRATRYYFLTGKRFHALEAQQIGLVHEVVPMAELSMTGERIAQEILTHSPHAVKEVKKLIATVTSRSISPELGELTAKHLAEMRCSHDANEGLASFVQKRQPKW